MGDAPLLQLSACNTHRVDIRAMLSYSLILKGIFERVSHNLIS